MSKHHKLLIIGAGGHGRVAADVAERCGLYTHIAFLDDGAPGASFPYPVLGGTAMAEELLEQYDMFVAIGNSAVRQRIMDRLAAAGAELAVLVSPQAVVGARVTLGEGSIVMPGAVINADAVIGRGVIVNTAASVDHDCRVGDFCHVAVGAHLCGTVVLGQHCWIGAGATVIQNIRICPDCTIGAGSVAVKNIEAAGTYIGVPARRLSCRS